MKITTAQLARLQTCCSQMARSVVGFDGSRACRLAWAGTLLGREISSFSALTVDQARTLIDAAQGDLGHRAPLKPGARNARTRPRTESEARRAGLDGRHDGGEFNDQPQMVSRELLDTIASYYGRLGWDLAQFDAWLHARSSPIKPARQIRTVAQANRVLWALKSMLQDAGLWVDFKEVA